MSDFTHRVVLVTGGTRGIGRACAEVFAEAGAKVALCGRSAATVGETAQLLSASGKTVQGFVADVSDPKQVDDLVEAVSKSFGQISILVNNAGITRDGLLMRMKDDDWTAVLETNLNATFYTCRAVARGMVKQRYGRIINVSSVVGMRGQAGQANYAAAKAGLIGFTKSLGRELATRNVTANVVAPGLIETDMTKDLNDDQRQYLLSMCPMGREGKPREVAEAVKFFASEEACYVTGQVLCVDGGSGM